MSAPSPGYSITVRAEAPAAIDTTGVLAAAVASAGGALTALDVVESRGDKLVVDVTLQRLGRRPRRAHHRRDRCGLGRDGPQGQ